MSSNSFDEESSAGRDEFKALPVELPAALQNKPRARRGSVSAESDRTEKIYKKITIPKTEDQMNRIRNAVKKSILFTGLDKQQSQDIVDAMQEVKVNAGDTVIRESETGDYFYVIDHGKFDVFKTEQGTAKKVFEYNDTGSFGELALMYNCPRAATVTATTEATLWRVDRETFRHIIIDSTAKKRKLFEEFLESIPILANLSRQERSLVADCLETVQFHSGDYVLKQGDIDADQVFFIIKGTAQATQTSKNSASAIKVGEMKAGEYFGERSLITREPRAANVIAVTDLECAAMDRSAFERLLGDVKEVMSRQIKQYKTAEQIQQEPTSNPEQ
jgi:CRP-like cAMP-binding protein